MTIDEAFESEKIPNKLKYDAINSFNEEVFRDIIKGSYKTYESE